MKVGDFQDFLDFFFSFACDFANTYSLVYFLAFQFLLFLLFYGFCCIFLHSTSSIESSFAFIDTSLIIIKIITIIIIITIMLTFLTFLCCQEAFVYICCLDFYPCFFPMIKINSLWHIFGLWAQFMFRSIRTHQLMTGLKYILYSNSNSADFWSVNHKLTCGNSDLNFPRI